MSSEFSKGFWIGLGVVVALVAVGFVTRVVKV